MSETPEQWFDCSHCRGEGITRHRITVYELGCGFPHDDVAEAICSECDGDGGWIGDAEGDVSEDAMPTPDRKLA